LQLADLADTGTESAAHSGRQHEARPMIQLPTITLNGTSPDSLLDDYCTAASAIRKGRDALQKAAPNARDYCQGAAGSEDWMLARNEHFARLAALDGILADLEDLAQHASNVVDAREQRRSAQAKRAAS
jgi:hypothetical protein